MKEERCEGSLYASGEDFSSKNMRFARFVAKYMAFFLKKNREFQYGFNFYLYYLVNWPEYYQVAEHPNGQIMGYSECYNEFRVQTGFQNRRNFDLAEV